jgi:hypothetical protein
MYGMVTIGRDASENSDRNNNNCEVTMYICIYCICSELILAFHLIVMSKSFYQIQLNIQS